MGKHDALLNISNLDLIGGKRIGWSLAFARIYAAASYAIQKFQIPTEGQADVGKDYKDQDTKSRAGKVPVVVLRPLLVQ